MGQCMQPKKKRSHMITLQYEICIVSGRSLNLGNKFISELGCGDLSSIACTYRGRSVEFS